MTTTLSEGVKVPDVGSVNWAGDLEVNWNLLNGALANLSGNVKTDRDNTWTGEQSFTLPIVGSITGTASKAIADEDGTSIKTGYVNVAGNQTVTGQKTWSESQFFTSSVYQKNTTYEIGTTPASNIAISRFSSDKDNKYTGCLRNAISTAGLTSVELEARNKVGSGALSPTGNATSSTFKVEVQSNGDKTLYFDGSIRNNVLPYATNTYALGSSSYQWSAVYAQSYYYNGTVFTDKFVTTDTDQSIASLKTIATASSPQLRVKSTSIDLTNTAITSYRTISIRAIDKNDTTLGQISWNYKASDNTGRLNLVQTSRDAVTGGIIIQHNGSNSTTDIMPYDTTNDHNLGTSTNKWKSLNGINPGALSLPNTSASTSIDISAWSTRPAEGVIGSVTASVDGWLNVQIKRDIDFSVWVIGSYRQLFRAGVDSSGKYLVMILYPIEKGRTVNLYTSPIENSESDLVFGVYRLYPCQGNV